MGCLWHWKGPRRGNSNEQISYVECHIITWLTFIVMCMVVELKDDARNSIDVWKVKTNLQRWIFGTIWWKLRWIIFCWSWAKGVSIESRRNEVSPCLIHGGHVLWAWWTNVHNREEIRRAPRINWAIVKGILMRIKCPHEQSIRKGLQWLYIRVVRLPVRQMIFS